MQPRKTHKDRRALKERGNERLSILPRNQSPDTIFQLVLSLRTGKDAGLRDTKIKKISHGLFIVICRRVNLNDSNNLQNGIRLPSWFSCQPKTRFAKSNALQNLSDSLISQVAPIRNAQKLSLDHC